MYNGILSTIGQTPLVQLDKLYPKLPLNLYAKLEMFNPGGSIKDRPAFLMLSKALEEGTLKKGATVIESSSGNMAIGLAQACRYLDLNLIVVVDPKINSHTLKILQSYGAKIEKVTKTDVTGNYLQARLQRVKTLQSAVPNSFWPNQYTNKYNPMAHYQTMSEIDNGISEPPDYLLAATSTCGTIMGCANYVRQNELPTKIVAVDAEGSVIFGTPSADRLIPGHGAGRPSDLLDKDAVDLVMHIADEECIRGCRRLLHREAILAGGSSGAVVMAAEKLHSIIPAGSTCVLILPDSGERYLDTIYNDTWVEGHFGKFVAPETTNTQKNSQKINIPLSTNGKDHKKIKVETKNGRKSETHKIAIIGGGPKGLYGFERLAAQFNAYPPDGKVEIHIYNRSSHFGAGEVYRTDQPPHLITNNPVGDINIWIAEDLPPVVKNPLPLTEWLRKKENKKITASDYVGRAEVGKYLENEFKLIASNLPAGVRGKYLVGEVIDLNQKGKKYILKLKTALGAVESVAHRYDHILLATGHPKKFSCEEEIAYQKFVDGNEKTGFIPFIYPVEPTLSNIPAGCKVAIKGIGLTFVDAVLSLTEGRGGKFDRDETSGKLTYLPSGQEPDVLYPFSRSGLPMIPRGVTPGKEMPLKFFTKSALGILLNHQKEGKIDFKKQILPLLKQEMIFAFYNVKLNQSEYKNDLSVCDTFEEVQHHIRLFHEQNPEEKPFNPELFLEPLKNEKFQGTLEFAGYIQSYLEFFLEEARKGEQKSPWAAVIAVWRKAIPVFGEYYNFGGLNPRSHRFFDTKFRRLLDRVTFGPPVESIEKLVALMDAEVLSFEIAQDPAISLDKKTDMFVLKSSHYNTQKSIHCLVDARIPKVSLLYGRAPFYQNMLEKGIISIYENDSGQCSYQPGCINITPWGFVIDEEGNTNTAIAVTGTPTEGITFDNDTLSRCRNNFVSNWAAFIRKKYTKSFIDQPTS